MAVKLIKNKAHMVVKRDGRIEPFDPNKLRRVIAWATKYNYTMTDYLLESINVKIYDKISIQKLYDVVINTAENMIGQLFPQMDDVAKRLYLLKIYKETWNLKKAGVYPEFLQVIKKGLQYGIYDKKVIQSFTKEELEELGKYIEPNRDFLFNYAGLNIFYKKYCLNYTKTKKLELPQHTYMRVAMFSFYTERDKKKRLELIKEKYDLLSTHTHTEATPKMLNAMTPKPQLASCVLMTMDDDTFSILRTAENCGIFSKYAGGLAIDVSLLRCEDSFIEGNRGISSGPVPFIKLIESIVSAFNQGGKRKGSAVISFPFWHYNVEDMIMLKDAGGSEERRARKLQYAFKWYDRFTKAILNKENIHVVDPKDKYELAWTYGKEFEEIYDSLKEKSNIRKKTISATDLVHKLLEVRKETGNIYITFVDNINYQRMGEVPVFSSNLCQEVVIPSFPSYKMDEKLEVYFDEIFNLNGKQNVTKLEFIKPGEIGLCNLASVDLYWWYQASENEKILLARNLLRSFDNGIDNQYYPVSEGKYSNIRRRPIGIGTFNLAKLLASLGIKFTDDDAKEIVHQIYEDLTFIFLYESVMLAKERGHYHTINGSRWKEGKVPLDVSILQNRIGDKRPDLNRHLYRDWDILRDLIKTYGVRFSYHFAIAPTANSVKSINATESIEPVLKLFVRDRGTFDLPMIPPGLNRGYKYQIAWEIPPKTLIELAAIRQKFIDQSQSINLYYVKPEKTSEVLDDIIYAQLLGIKTLYYMKTPKPGEVEEVCESCVT